MIKENEIMEILVNHYPYEVTAKAIIDKIKKGEINERNL